MHPILKRRSRLVLYLAVWIVFGLLLTVVFIFGGRAPPLWSLQFAVPMAMLLGMHFAVLLVSRAVHAAGRYADHAHGRDVGVGRTCLAARLARDRVTCGRSTCCPTSTDIRDDAAGILGLLIFAGAIGISLAVLGHYLAGAFERSRNAERRALELQVLAREAELKSLRAQLDPHFLFNSLNSVAALIGNDTAAARQMCFLMAQFFRKSLTLGARAVDSARRRRSRWRRRSSRSSACASASGCAPRSTSLEDVRDVSVPPLLLQPLVENAVHHGVAHLLEGGEVCVTARRREELRGAGGRESRAIRTGRRRAAPASVWRTCARASRLCAVIAPAWT